MAVHCRNGVKEDDDGVASSQYMTLTNEWHETCELRCEGKRVMEVVVMMVRQMENKLE